MAYYWLGSTYDRQSRVAQSSSNFDQVHGTPRPLLGKDAFPPGQTTLDTRRPQAYLDRFTRFEAIIASNADQVHATPRPLVGKDALPTVGEATLDTRRPPAYLVRQQFAAQIAGNFDQVHNTPLPLQGKDVVPPGQSTTDTRRPAAFLARQFRYPVYDANSINSILPEAAPVAPMGQSTALSELPPRTAQRVVDLSTYVDGSENWLFGTDAMLVGAQSVALPPIAALRARDYSLTESFPLSLIGQDAMAAGEQLTELSPHAALRAPDYTWTQDLIPNLIGQDAMVTGQQSFALPPSPAPLRLRDYSIAEAFPLTLISQDQMATGAQSTSLPPVGPQRARDYTFAPPINLPTLTTVVQQIPYGAQLTDSLPPRAAPRLRDYTWSQDLIPDLIGQDAVNPGQQSFVLAPSPTPLRLRDYSITAAFPLELISQDALVVGRQSFDLAPIAALRARDYSFTPPVNLACLTTVVQPIPYGQQSTDNLPPRAAPRARDYTFTAAFPLTLNGQDAMVVGDQFTQRPPYAPQRAATLSDPGINLTIAITVVPLPAGAQLTELSPKPAARARDYTHLDQTKRQLIGQDALPNGQNADRSALPPKAAQRARDYTWLQSMPLYIFQQLPTGHSTAPTEGPPKGPLRLRDYTHLDVTKQNLIGQDAMVTGQSWLRTDNLPPKAYPRLVDYTWFARFSLPDLIAHQKPGHHTLTDRALFVHALSDRALFEHVLSDRSLYAHTTVDQEMSQ